ncbi:MAG: O-antigen ligase family protein, partial [Dehalococcoidia bacterium]
MNFPQILYLVIPLLLVAVLIFKFPGLGLVLCLVVGSLFKGMIQPLLGSIDITVFLFVVTFGSILIRCSLEKKLALPDLKINIGVLLFIGLLLTSLLYTPLPEQGANVFLRSVFLTIPMMYAIFMWCNNIDRIKRLLTIFVVVVLAYTTVIIVWALIVQRGASLDPRDVFGEIPVLAVAQFLAAGIITAFILRGFVSGRYKRLALYLVILAGVVELIALNSRGPLIALVIGAICLFLLYSPREKGRVVLLAIPLLAIIVCTVVLLPEQYTSRYALLADLGSSSVAARLGMWQFVGTHFSEWFFTGAGMFGFAYYYFPGQVELSIWGAYPHNIFLDVFAAAGFFTLLVFAWLIGSFIYRGIKTSRMREPSAHLLALATVVPLIVFLVAGLFSMSIIGTRPLWFFGGAIIALERWW